MIIILRSYRGVIMFLLCFAFFAWLTIQNNRSLDHHVERVLNAFGVLTFIGYLWYIVRK